MITYSVILFMQGS